MEQKQNHDQLQGVFRIILQSQVQDLVHLNSILREVDHISTIPPNFKLKK